MPANQQFFSEEQPYKTTHLLELVNDNDVEGVKALIKNAECDVNECDSYSSYPTTKAASNNNFVILELLYDAGARLNVIDGFGKSPLDYARRNRNFEMESYIIEGLRIQNITPV